MLCRWDNPLPWRDERHIRITLATDASASGWSGSVILGDRVVQVSDYWTGEEQGLDIATKEALAIDKVVLSFSDSLRNAWVDAPVDNQAIIHSSQRQGGRSPSLNNAMKKLFFTMMKLNTSFYWVYIPTSQNEADAPSRWLTNMDCKLHPDIWGRVQRKFGGSQGHTCDAMALDSNAMADQEGVLLSHFTPHTST